jgi:hypothetical protein
VDGVLQLILLATAPRSDGLTGSMSHNVTDRCSEGWPLVPVEDLVPREVLYSCLDFLPPWTRDSLDPVSWGGGDAQVSQQSPKSTGGDPSFRPKGLHLLSVSVHLLTLYVAQGRVLLIIFIFTVDIVALLLLLLLSRCTLGCWVPRYHQLHLKRLLLLRCVLWRVML